jgi:hypothetical protein
LSIRNEIGSLGFYCWILAAEIIKIGYVTTCDCRGIGQPFSGWFFQAFHQSPYSLWWDYRPTPKVTIHFLAGPYSLFWYFLNLPAFFGYEVFFGFLLACDLAVFFLLARQSRLYGVYWLTLSVWFTTIDPVDFWIVAFGVLGRYRSVFLALSPLTKLPIGSEVLLGNLSVWSWVFTSHNSAAGVENWGRYLLVGSIWLFSFACYIWPKVSSKIRHQMKNPAPFDPESHRQEEIEIGMTEASPDKQ